MTAKTVYTLSVRCNTEWADDFLVFIRYLKNVIHAYSVGKIIDDSSKTQLVVITTLNSEEFDSMLYDENYYGISVIQLYSHNL